MNGADLLSIAGAQGIQIGWTPNGPQLVFAGAGQQTLAELLTAASGADLAAGVGPAGLSIPNADLQSALAQRLAMQGLVVTHNRPTKARRMTMGLQSDVAIPAGAVATIIQQPQVPFQPTRLMVPSDIAGGFVVIDVRVGKNSQFPVVGAIPARAFQENATDAGLVWDTAQISQQIAIQVQNIGGAPATFRAALYGNAIE